MYRKLASKLLLLLLVFTLAVPSAFAKVRDDDSDVVRDQVIESRSAMDQFPTKSVKKAISAKPVEAREVRELNVSNTLLSLSEAREVEVSFEAEDSVTLDDLEWTFGGQSFEKWRKWNAKEKNYTGEPFITFSEEPHRDGNMIKAIIKFDLVYSVLVNGKEIPATDLSPRSFRTRILDLIGTYDLGVKDKETDIAYVQEVKLNIYDNFHTYAELKPAIDEIFKEAKKDRYLKYQVIGKSVQGRDLHFVILAKDKKSVDTYLDKLQPKMLKNPDNLLNDLKKGKLKNYKVPVWLNNPHPDETPAMDGILEILRQLATQDEVEFKEKDGKGEVTIDVEDALDNVIFLFNLSQNPDGRAAMTRANANNFDVNRDHTYQTQPEAIATTGEMVKWTPLSFFDFHGFVSDFLIEPCTPPHNPSFEYDLLMNVMLDQAEAMGEAGIANTNYDHYLLAKDYDGGKGWDDYGTAYTAVYALAQGIFGHTIEVPELNEESYHATVYAGLGGIKFVLDNKDRLFKTQLEIFQRGIENKDAHSVDKWLVDEQGDVVGRPRGEHKNFFPEYYVLPIDKKLQKNPLEAAQMVEYLMRNGVEVKQTTKDVKVDDVTYPKGTYVVDMHQAKRGFAQVVLFDGEDISQWSAMYDTMINSFHDLRGFTRDEVREKGVFDKTAKTLIKANFKLPKSEIAGTGKKYIIRNVTNDAIKAVNKLLDDGKTVEMVLESGKDFEKGDFLVSKKDLDRVDDIFYLQAIAVKDDLKAVKLKQPKVYVPAVGHAKFVLEELGFKLAKSAKDSDVIVDEQGAADEDDMDNKPYIGIGGETMEFVKGSDILSDFDIDYTDSDGLRHEGVLAVEVSQDDVRTAPYEEEDYVYTATSTWITDMPKDSEVLVTVSDDDDFFKAGWWPNHDKVKGKVLAISVDRGDDDITLFANDLVWRAHPENGFRMLANSIYASMLDE